MKIRLNNGLYIKLQNTKISIDSRLDSKSQFGVISHAHADHTPSSFSDGEYICSDMTYSLVKKRVGEFNRKNCSDNIKLFNSGHIPGSTSVLFDYEDRVFYTGDFSIRDRMHLNGLEPPSCDKLIIESTYGHPRYKFPNQDVLENNIVEWFSSMRGEKVVCDAYSLGRAQEIEILARRAGFSDILVNKATKDMNNIISDDNYSFSTELYDNDKISNDSLLISSNKNHIEKFSEVDNVSVVKFTGWAIDNRYDQSNLYDKAFTLSDHADFNELISVVEKTKPNKVYTIHGHKDWLSKEINKRFENIKARSLKDRQMRLSEF